MTGNASLEAKMIQQLTDMREKFLYKNFLDLHKAYDDLNKDIYIGILEGYRMGPRSLCLLHI